MWRLGDKQTHLALPAKREILNLLDWADVVQANTPTPLVYLTLGLARVQGVPSVAGFHSQEESATLHFSLARPPVEAALQAWFGRLYKRPDCITAPTAFAAELVRRYTDRPIHVVSNGIRLPEDEAGERREGSSQRRRLLAGGQFLFAYVGRLAQEKGPAEHAGAYGFTHTPAAGRGPCRGRHRSPFDGRWSSRRRGSEWRNRFVFWATSPRKKKHALLRAADLFIMPSPTELQSIATLEAMVRGCAVVAANSESSAVGELVRESNCGICYSPGRLDEGAREVRHLLDRPDELEHLQKNAADAARHHDVNESGRRLEWIYHSLLEERSKNVVGEIFERNESWQIKEQ